MRTICSLFMLTLISSIAFAQKSAVEAYAKDDDTHLLFSDEGYNKSKNYVLISISHMGSSGANKHTEQFKAIEGDLEGVGNVKVLNVQWSTDEDLRKSFDQFGIEVKVSDSKSVNIKSDNFNLNTSSPNAFFLIEGKDAALVCSGGQCEKTLNKFFASSR